MNAEPLSTDGRTGREIRWARHSGTEEQFITVPELAGRLGRSKESLYQAARREEIPGAFLIGRKWAVNWHAFQAATAAAHGPLRRS
jgi:predicted DNA-binding transcriptional regulator AlpA